jgi:hypothetical protein
MAANKKTIDAVLDIAGVGPTEKRLVRAENMTAAEFQATQTAKLQRIAAKLADRLEAECGELPATSLAINIGIISDKLRDLGATAAPAVTNQTNILVNGMNRAALVQLLSGKRAPKPVSQAIEAKAQHINTSAGRDASLQSFAISGTPKVSNRSVTTAPAPETPDSGPHGNA